MICETCNGTSFYEDRQGGHVCSQCGQLSQDYIPESFDAEGFVAAGRIRTIKQRV